MKWYSVSEYLEEDAHSRDYMKAKLCIVSGQGYSNRGIPVREWVDVKASSAKDAKARFKRGEGIKRS